MYTSRGQRSISSRRILVGRRCLPVLGSRVAAAMSGYRYIPSKDAFLKLSQAVGRVIRKEVAERAEVQVQLHRMNPYNCVYFPEHGSLDTYDPGDKCTLGDIVLIKKLTEPRRHVETHEIKEIVFKAGNVIDPITGFRVEGDRYLVDDVLSEEERQAMIRDMAKRETAYKYSYELDQDRYFWESRNLARKRKKDEQ